MMDLKAMESTLPLAMPIKQKATGTPPDAIDLYLYGRYSGYLVLMDST